AHHREPAAPAPGHRRRDGRAGAGPRRRDLERRADRGGQRHHRERAAGGGLAGEGGGRAGPRPLDPRAAVGYRRISTNPRGGTQAAGGGKEVLKVGKEGPPERTGPPPVAFPGRRGFVFGGPPGVGAGPGG